MVKKGEKVILLSLFVILFSILVGCDSETAAEKTGLERIKEKGKLVIGVKSDYPPYAYINEKGQYAGFEIDMARRLAEDLFGSPEKVEFVPVTGSNRIPYLQTGKVDVILATMSITEERAKQVDFSEPYFKSGVQLLVAKNSQIKDIQDLKGKKVIVVPGSTANLGLAKLVPDAELVKLQKTSEAIQALKDQRAEAFAQDNTLLYSLANKYPEFKVVGKPFNEGPWALAARKGEKDVVDWLNKNLNKWEKEDYYYKLYNRWIAKSMPKEFDPSTFLRRSK